MDSRYILAELLSCQVLDIEFLASTMSEFEVQTEELDFYDKNVNLILADVFRLAIENENFDFAELMTNDIISCWTNSLDTHFYINGNLVVNKDQLCFGLSNVETNLVA